jgi:hypothetical protein
MKIYQVKYGRVFEREGEILQGNWVRYKTAQGKTITEPTLKNEFFASFEEARAQAIKYQQQQIFINRFHLSRAIENLNALLQNDLPELAIQIDEEEIEDENA